VTIVNRWLQQLLNYIPFTADVEWWLLRNRPLRNKRYQRLYRNIASWVDDFKSAPSPQREIQGKKILIFATIYLWLQYSVGLSLVLTGLGHQVKFAYLPYHDWFNKELKSQLIRLNYFLERAFSPLVGIVDTIPLYTRKNVTGILPQELEAAVEQVTVRDFQYSRQVEEVDERDPLYRLRRHRNFQAAIKFYQLIKSDRPDQVIVPNGMILEFGVLFAVGQYFSIPVVTYEFGEQKNRVWISQNVPVMFQDTREIWEVYKGHPFTEDQHEKIEKLFVSRKNATLWQQFSRQWQELPAEGIRKVKEKVGLDERPVVLLAANVIGDSLTLGRQVFSETMSEWISRTLDYFKNKDNVQFILRIHPGERYTDGPSVEDVVWKTFVDLPGHYHIVSANDPVNTYDLVAVADLGLTYTTTVGMEMAMSGLPVIVSGNTHYRGKGFTLDPSSWEEYYALIDQVLASPETYRLNEESYHKAWHYAYRFFFNYPFPSPWHLRGMQKMIQEKPISWILSAEGQHEFGRTFQFLAGEKVNLVIAERGDVR
jgi:hypothetical protein